MNFDKNSLSGLLKLNDNELEAVIREIAAEAGVDKSIEIKRSDILKIRSFLSVAAEEDIVQLLERFGGKRNG